MARMLNCGYDEKMSLLKLSGFQEQCNRVGQYLRELRAKRDMTTTDIVIVCAGMEFDHLHSGIGAAHSSQIRAMANKSKAPFCISLFNCKHSIVSAIIDWMYTGELQVAPEQYGEYMEVVNRLGISNLQQKLEEALQELAAHNNILIECVNIATNPKSLVSSKACSAVCTTFVANMHTLSETDIQRLTFNAVLTLVTSPNITLYHKIDIINFALQWLKNVKHAEFSDSILSSLFIETLRPHQLTALTQHLRLLYRELPDNFLATLHLYCRGKRVVVSVDPKKYAKTNNVVVPIASTKYLYSITGPEEQFSSVEAAFVKPASDTTNIQKLPNPDEQVEIYQPTQSGSQDLVNAWALTIHNNTAYRISKERKFLQHFDTISCQSCGATGVSTLREYDNFPDTSDNKGCSICESDWIYGSQNSVFDRQFRESTGSTCKSPTTTLETDSWRARYGPDQENVVEINNFPQRCFATNQFDIRMAGAGSPEKKSAETIGRRCFGSESLIDIDEIPNQFESEVVTNVQTAVSAGGRSTGRNARSNESIEEIQKLPDSFLVRKKSCETLNRYAFGPDSILEINRLPMSFSSSSKTSIYSQTPRTAVTATDPYGSSNQRIVSGLNGIERQTGTRTIPITSESIQSPSTETVNRYVYGAESVSDINNLPEQFYGYYTPHPTQYPGGNRTVYNLTEQIRSVKVKEYVGNIYDKQGYENYYWYAPMDWPKQQILQEHDLRTVNRYVVGEQSCSDIRSRPKLFLTKHHEVPRKNFPSGIISHPSYDIGSSEDIGVKPKQFSSKKVLKVSKKAPTPSPSQKVINRHLFSAQSLRDIHNIPEQFTEKGFIEATRGRSKSQELINPSLISVQSVRDIQALPDQFPHKAYVPKSRSQEVINRRLFGPESFRDIHAIPEQFTKKQWNRVNERIGQHSSPTERRLSGSIKSLIRDRSFGSASSDTTSSLEDQKTKPYMHCSNSDVDINGKYPEFVREDHVIGKKALTREEREELREIPPIVDTDSVKLPIINRYEVTTEELEDLHNLPDIVDSQYTIGRRLWTDEEIKELQALPDIESNSRNSDTTLLTARADHSRPSSVGLTNDMSSGLSSSYVAPDMSRPTVSSLASEYMMHKPFAGGNSERRLYW